MTASKNSAKCAPVCVKPGLGQGPPHSVARMRKHTILQLRVEARAGIAEPLQNWPDSVNAHMMRSEAA
eukprot:194419-Pyramimonas_sp.AAC.1